MIHATVQFFLILQKLNKAAPIDLLSSSEIAKGEKAIKQINENVTLFNLTVNGLHNNEILTEITLKDLSQTLKQIAEDSYKLHELLVAICKRY